MNSRHLSSSPLPQRLLFAFTLVAAGCGSGAIPIATPDLSMAAVVVDMAVTLPPDLTTPPDLAPLCRPTMGCVAPNSCCDGACTDVSKDPKNCGGCGIACAAGNACCTGNCVDLTKSGSNCGACGVTCSYPMAAGSCTNSACTVGACQPQWADCNNDPKDGCETRLDVSVTNCGKCGANCAIANAVPGCDDHGCYLRSCNFGWDDCNVDESDGCEISVLSDPKNCGACGRICAAPNAKAGCNTAACVILSCGNNYFDCDGQYANGCETLGLNDAKNCGGCGLACANGLICKAGQCTCPNCSFANASSRCVNNVCTMDKCNAGFGDCDKNVANGCETDLTGDAKNCGACGMVCPQNMASCSPNGCVNGWFPVGPQVNIPDNMLAGWTVCYSDVYSKTQVSLVNTILTQCNGSKLMLACRQTGSNTLTTLAQGDRADVIFDVGNGAGSSHDGNGTSWYYSGTWSWGYYAPGDGVSRNSCDTAGGKLPTERLCWHTGGGNISGGYRCGSTTGLNNSGAWERVVYQIP